MRYHLILYIQCTTGEGKKQAQQDVSPRRSVASPGRRWQQVGEGNLPTLRWGKQSVWLATRAAKRFLRAGSRTHFGRPEGRRAGKISLFAPVSCCVGWMGRGGLCGARRSHSAGLAGTVYCRSLKVYSCHSAASVVWRNGAVS